MNSMNIADSVESTNFVIKPTHTDVLLGRGVGTNRHAGNTNFRHIVSQHVVSSHLVLVRRLLADFDDCNQRTPSLTRIYFVITS